MTDADTAASRPVSLAATATVAAPPPRDERARRIAALLPGARSTVFAPFRGGHVALPVVTLPQETLAYRAENGRLIAELRELVRERGGTMQALEAAQDTAEVQQLLHDLLAVKASDPEGAIQQELARQGQQTEPLLISADGVLVNGNRRMAAMRELLAQDPQRYAGFQEVSAAVLPADAGAADIEAVEAALQMAPETKLAYGWVHRRLKLRRQRDELGVPVADIVEAFRLPGAAQLDREIGELALAEAYLADFLGAPGRYSLVANAEPLFVGLNERLGLLPEELRGLWRQGGFTLIHGRAAVQGPLERYFPFAAPTPEHLPAWGLRRFAEEQELGGVDDGPAEASTLTAETRENLQAAFADSSRSEILAPALFSLLERLRAEFMETHTPVRMLKLLQKARQTMGDLAPETMTERHRRQLRNELAAIQGQAAALLGDGPAAEPSGGGGLAGQLAGLLKRR